MANSPRIWNELLEGQIYRSEKECRPTNKKCLHELLRSLAACDGVGDARLQNVVEKSRHLTEVKAGRLARRHTKTYAISK